MSGATPRRGRGLAALLAASGARSAACEGGGARAPKQLVRVSAQSFLRRGGATRVFAARAGSRPRPERSKTIGTASQAREHRIGANRLAPGERQRARWTHVGS